MRKQIELNTSWNKCKLIFNSNISNKPIITSDAANEAWEEYIRVIGNFPKDLVWYDIDKKYCFGKELNWPNSGTIISSFVESEQDFLSSRYGVETIKHFTKNYHNLPRDHFLSRQVISDIPPVEKSTKDILVVGGGPSCAERFGEIDIEKYDEIVTCNHFFVSEIFKDPLVKSKTKYAVIGREVDLSIDNKQLYDFLETTKTNLVFEAVDDGSIRSDMAWTNKINLSHPERINFINCRYRSKIGTGPRIIVLALYLGAKNVDIIGVDGMRSNTKRGDLHGHAFEQNKKYNQSNINYDLYRMNHVLLWDYLNYLSNISEEGLSFTNLGEGHPANQSSSITAGGFFKDAHK